MEKDDKGTKKYNRGKGKELKRISNEKEEDQEWRQEDEIRRRRED